ncbi:MAG: hypothetical protein ACXWVS_04060, partial [Hyphomicrobium sp.]
MRGKWWRQSGAALAALVMSWGVASAQDPSSVIERTPLDNPTLDAPAEAPAQAPAVDDAYSPPQPALSGDTPPATPAPAPAINDAYAPPTPAPAPAVNDAYTPPPSAPADGLSQATTAAPPLETMPPPAEIAPPVAAIEWQVDNPFRFFKNASDTEVHRATWMSLDAAKRATPILAAEQELSQRHPEGWAATMIDDVCWNVARNRHDCGEGAAY